MTNELKNSSQLKKIKNLSNINVDALINEEELEEEKVQELPI